MVHYFNEKVKITTLLRNIRRCWLIDLGKDVNAPSVKQQELTSLSSEVLIVISVEVCTTLGFFTINFFTEITEILDTGVIMIELDNFVSLVRKAIPRFRDYPPNQDQEKCITHSPEIPLMIVAGPGSGKTTVLVLRALRLVFVDGFRPEEILITTFTKKAATEIRSRLIEWGSDIVDYLQNTPSDQASAFQDWLDSIDVNQFITGTLDSICNDELTNVRLPSDPTPVLIEKFVSNALFMFEGLFPVNAQNDRGLNEYLSTFTGKTDMNFKEKLEICRTIIDRFVHDQVNLRSYQHTTEYSEARRLIIKSFNLYRETLTKNNQLVLCHMLSDGYNLLSLMRASCVVNRHLTVARC
ncbi:hypothetical protein C6500_17305 [Candidatus Poribacteria bacterium]|nr:MAG: hypothetical protein C6500_17305 [Candidatus Poribacteria bacterium]